jgi:hypothetical protein
MKLLLIFCLIFPFQVLAQNSGKLSSDPSFGFRLYHENDFFFINNKDDNYTGGQRLEIIFNYLNTALCHSILNPLRWEPIQQHFSVNFTAFTPQNLEDSQIIKTERPYASYQHLSFGASYWTYNQKRKYSYELLVGEFGRAFTGKTQIYGHRELAKRGLSDRPVPEGWHHQVAAGGALAINAKLNYHQILSRKEVKERTNRFVLIWRNELNLGQYLTNAYIGLRLFYGSRKISPLLEGEPEISVFAANRRRPRVYGYITPKLKGVWDNATLTGRYLNKESSHTIHPNKISRGILEYDAGVQLNYGAFRIGGVLMGRGKEYKIQQKWMHHWGGLYFGFIWRN